MGVNQSFSSLGRILGPFLGSVLFQMGASRTLPYLAGVGVLLVVAALIAASERKELTTESQRTQSKESRQRSEARRQDACQSLRNLILSV